MRTPVRCTSANPKEKIFLGRFGYSQGINCRPLVSNIHLIYFDPRIYEPQGIIPHEGGLRPGWTMGIKNLDNYIVDALSGKVYRGGSLNTMYEFR